jgi:Domain of unknown function (DUF4160)
LACDNAVPKLYEYLGLTVFFYSDEHLPVHVHGRSERRENRAELIVVDGKIREIKITLVEGRSPLRRSELKDFEKLIEARAQEILLKWVAYFVENKKVEVEIITRKIK